MLKKINLLVTLCLFVGLLSCQNQEVTPSQHPITNSVRNQSQMYMGGFLLNKPFLLQPTQPPQDGWYAKPGVISISQDGKPLYINHFTTFNLSKDKKMQPGQCAVTIPSIDLSSLPHVLAANDYYNGLIFRNLFSTGRQSFAFGTTFSAVPYSERQDGFGIDFYFTSYGNDIGESIMSSRLGKQDANASFTILSIETVTEDELLVTYKVNCKLFNQKGKYLGDLKDAEIRVIHSKGFLAW